MKIELSGNKYLITASLEEVSLLKQSLRNSITQESCILSSENNITLLGNKVVNQQTIVYNKMLKMYKEFR